jgi:hypothetical protein
MTKIILIRVKVNLFLCSAKHHTMKTYCGSEDTAPRNLHLGTSWRVMVSFTNRPLYPRERDPGTHWIGGCIGPRAGLDAVVKRKIPSPSKIILDFNS